MKRLFVLTAFVLLALPLAAQDFPQGIPFRMNGMDKPAIVTREASGIPHVFALTKHDLYFANGWLHASDRFFQMDTLRHIGSGTFAEMVGTPALSTDVQLRTFGLRRAADLSLAAYSASTKAVLDAYTQGVNQWLQTHQLPVEYGLLGISSVDPWTDTDSVTIGKLLAFQLSFDLSDDIDRTTALLSYEIAGQAVGFNGQALFGDLFRTAGFDPAATIPDATGGKAANGLPAPKLDTSWIKPETIDLLNRWVEETKDIPIVASFHAENHAGSNEWAIAASNSTTGAPLLANDPHLPLTTPSTFYPISLHLFGGTNVNGMGFPGTPGVIQGQNEHLTWGSTVHPMDVTDAYQEQIVPDPTSPSQLSSIYKGQKEKIQVIPQLFRIRIGGTLVTADPAKSGVPPATLIVPRHGPIISLDAAHGTAISVQYTGLYPTHELEALLGFDDAQTLDDFKAALQLFDFGSQNWAVASTDGHIAYFTSGELPIREDLQAGTVTGLPPYFIRNGTGGNEWLATAHPQPNQAIPFEILPYSEMPQVVDPANGFFVNANNDPTGQSRDNNALDTPRAGGGILYLSPGYSSMRAGRITQLVKAKLANGGKISPDDMKTIQADNVLYDAELFVPLITQALKNAQATDIPPLSTLGKNPAIVAAVNRLSKWDLSSPTGIPQGYDASEKTGDRNGQLSTPTQTEVDNSVGATIYSLWRGQFIKNTIDVPLDKIGIPRPGGELPLSALRNLLENYAKNEGVGAAGVPFFNVPGVTSAGDRRDILILKSIGDALTLASSDAFAPAFGKSTDFSNYQWGKLHRIVFTHYIGFESIGDVAGPIPPSLPGLPGISRQGGFQTVDAASHDVRASTVNGFMFGSGPNRRYVGDVQKGGINGQSSLPGGVSGTPGSPLSYNLLMLWLTNDTFPVVNDTSPRLPWLR